MPVTGPLSHIDISVGYPERAIPFYDALLTGLGYRRWIVDWREAGGLLREGEQSLTVA